MTLNLPEEYHSSLKQSFFNILAFFLERENIESKYIRCLLKWGLQLDLNKEDLVLSNMDSSQLSFSEPNEKIESLYHLVYLIYLDHLVEDVELEVAMLYGERLGFSPDIINDLVKEIAEKISDKDHSYDLKTAIREFIKKYPK
jgi:hypothetical protein